MQEKIDRFLKIGILIIAVGIFSLFMFDKMAYSSMPSENFFLTIIFAIIFTLAALISPPLDFILFYLIYRKITKNKIRKNAKFEEQNVTYCREHLNHLSPEILSYLNDFTIEPKKDISAHILKLLYEGYLVEENNHLIITEKNKTALSAQDQLILEMVQDHKIGIIKEQAYERAIETEAREQEFITSKKSELEKLILQFFIFCCSAPIFAVFITLFTTFFKSNNATIPFFMFFAITIFSLFMTFSVPYFIIKFLILLKAKTNIVRSKKGNQMLKNAIGLKKFLEDFSYLKQSSWKEVYTRDYYVIYAVALGINQKIPKEIMEMLQN